eukprot:3164111-Pyramimonas_sp.AAC.1
MAPIEPKTAFMTTLKRPKRAQDDPEKLPKRFPTASDGQRATKNGHRGHQEALKSSPKASKRPPANSQDAPR